MGSVPEERSHDGKNTTMAKRGPRLAFSGTFFSERRRGREGRYEGPAETKAQELQASFRQLAEILTPAQATLRTIATERGSGEQHRNRFAHNQKPIPSLRSGRGLRSRKLREGSTHFSLGVWFRRKLHRKAQAFHEREESKPASPGSAAC